MVGSKRLRLCSTCGTKHTKPTGKKCNKAKRPVSSGKAGKSKERAAPSSDSSWETDLGAAHNMRHAEPTKEAGITEDRFTKLETLVNKMAEVVLKEKPLPCLPPKQDFSSDSSTLSSSDSSRPPRSRFSLASSGRRRSRPARLFSQTRHVEKGEQLNTFEGLMVITFRTIIEMLEKGIPVMGIVGHGLTMAEKAASGAYVDKACIAYDSSVRVRAAKKGVMAFTNPVNEDLIRHFSLENSKKFEARAGQNSKKRKSSGVCFRFNSDSGCHAKSCAYGHRCSACNSEGHSVRDCKVGDRHKNAK